MANFVILLKKNLIEMVRNKRIIIFSIAFVAISLISAVMAKFLPELFKWLFDTLGEDGTNIGMMIGDASVADSYVQFVSNVTEIMILLIIIFFTGTIIKEKKTGTYDNLKMNSVKDHEIVLAHFVAQVILVTVSYIVGVAFFVLLNILLFRQIMGIRGVVALLYIYLTMLFVIAASLFVGCLFKKNFWAYFLAIIGYFALSFVDIIPHINKFNPFHLLTISMNLMYSESYSLSEHLITSIVTVLLTAGLVIVSLFIVKNKINNRKEITSENNSEGI